MHGDGATLGQDLNEAERLLQSHYEMNEMVDLNPGREIEQSLSRADNRYTDERSRADISGISSSQVPFMEAAEDDIVYKVYKRRWFGLVQLVLLNIVVSWDVSGLNPKAPISAEEPHQLTFRAQWLSFSAVADTAATHFSTTTSVINWLSTAFLFAFLAAAPLTYYTLHTGGPRLAIITSSILILVGNWLRYGGTRRSPPSFPLTMTGQILIGFAQPFVLSAPPHYSDIWFSPSGRVSATALASLANPFGGALGQLINPFLAPNPGLIPNMTLYVALISSVATLPSFFIPSKPPTPSSPASTHPRPSFRQTFRFLSSNPTFYLLFLPFATYVGLFNSASSLLTQIFSPYGFSDSESGIGGALLILVGLVAAAISSPLIDRSKAYLPLIKTLVPVIALSYLAFVWAPSTHSLAAPYVILSVLGAASFSLLPVALEWLVEVTFPVGPEAGSTIYWAGGQLFGGVFIVISDALKADEGAHPPFHMRRALVFQAVVAMAVVPAALALGWVGGGVRKGRLELDKGTRAVEVDES
ncbi:hypothetical protein MMC07_001800 [Pseudocyphellaria aurata]|nr:hypothetical protein [Pseudocyphellaria aurata]